MSNKFYSYWFSGLSQAIDKLNTDAADTMLYECGNACSESYTKDIYISEYHSSSSLREFLERLRGRFAEMQIQMISDNLVEIIYTFCGCDLVKDGFVSNPKFCRCSLHSLQINWDAAMGEGKTKVTMQKSILAGDDVCKFTVEIL